MCLVTIPPYPFLTTNLGRIAGMHIQYVTNNMPPIKAGHRLWTCQTLDSTLLKKEKRTGGGQGEFFAVGALEVVFVCLIGLIDH